MSINSKHGLHWGPLDMAAGYIHSGSSPWQLVPPFTLEKPGAQRQKKDPGLLRHSP